MAPFAIDPTRLQASLPLVHVEHHGSINSTSDRAAELALGRDTPLPVLIVADEQTAGRGRGENRWFSQPGALTFTLLIDAEAFHLAPEDWPVTSICTALAVCRAVEAIHPTCSPAIKWPNDVLVADQKLAGILLESPAGAVGRLAIGVGINVNNAQAERPAEIRDSSVALVDLIGSPLDLTDLLAALVGGLFDLLSCLSSEDARAPLADEWDDRNALMGRRVAVESAAGVQAGVCRSIAADGGLILEAEQGQLVICYSGTVSRLN